MGDRLVATPDEQLDYFPLALKAHADGDPAVPSVACARSAVRIAFPMARSTIAMCLSNVELY